ncbi:ADP-ribosylglycohydrolase family protein [Neisseria weaveri]|uniref:ADP-ribosyl-[dinitrogen reductase] hydrolase n=1 Tax=Neisseria weaveri TaxID=28091 RepID=A0A3S5C369_9NEIS|nr:ADP-ribosylglycohydrolase family protein [Neisseria weaveri]EGV35317.1 ADP-ribosylglycohydrolase family protein [Neisseria weaveri ATCC 51223]EGV37044.1 ADP-ribosylglycohydrolase family protein [Neisseria weaveri LMG 5135]VEJ49774.1 ADP-ribosyl-[dinitrogen reductase] hydrolase [Neisseria weaveri]
MLGAAIGDVVGSRFEFNNIKCKQFELFTHESFYTDDTVCTVAVAEWVLGDCRGNLNNIMQKWCRRYPQASYGVNFAEWIHSDMPRPYNSWGNGSAMRVSAVGWRFDTLEETLFRAEESAYITHDHPEGVKGAQATAAAIFLARQGIEKEKIRRYIEEKFQYNLDRTCDMIRPGYQFNESCMETVPEAIIAFLEGKDFEDSIRLAVSLGGDSDTLAAITGSIAEAYYGIPQYMKQSILRYIPYELGKVLLEI